MAGGANLLSVPLNVAYALSAGISVMAVCHKLYASTSFRLDATEVFTTAANDETDEASVDVYLLHVGSGGALAGTRRSDWLSVAVSGRGRVAGACCAATRATAAATLRAEGPVSAGEGFSVAPAAFIAECRVRISVRVGSASGR